MSPDTSVSLDTRAVSPDVLITDGSVRLDAAGASHHHHHTEDLKRLRMVVYPERDDKGHRRLPPASSAQCHSPVSKMCRDQVRQNAVASAALVDCLSLPSAALR
jgi:hypothetical protein